VVHAAVEAYGYDPEQIRPAAPGPQAITRMDEAFLWVGMIPANKRLLRRVVLMRALVHPITERHRWSWRRIGRALGCSHEAVRGWHAQGIDIIVAALRGQNIQSPPSFSRGRRLAMYDSVF